MGHYICCITRMMFNSHRLRGTTCRGEPSLFDTHCCMCGYWIENQADEEASNKQREEIKDD